MITADMRINETVDFVSKNIDTNKLRLLIDLRVKLKYEEYIKVLNILVTIVEKFSSFVISSIEYFIRFLLWITEKGASGSVTISERWVSFFQSLHRRLEDLYLKFFAYRRNVYEFFRMSLSTVAQTVWYIIFNLLNIIDSLKEIIKYALKHSYYRWRDIEVKIESLKTLDGIREVCKKFIPNVNRAYKDLKTSNSRIVRQLSAILLVIAIPTFAKVKLLSIEEKEQ